MSLAGVFSGAGMCLIRVRGGSKMVLSTVGEFFQAFAGAHQRAVS